MRSTILGTVLCIVAAVASAADSVSSIESKSTHRQATTIKLADDAPTINAFCLNAQGEIVAVCGSGPGELLIIDDSGEVTKNWEVDVKPEAVNVRPDGTLLVAGEGKLFHYDRSGKLLKTATSPHAARLKSDDEELRKSAIASLKQRGGRSMVEARVKSYKSLIEQLEKMSELRELTEAEKSTLQAISDLNERYTLQLEAMGDDDEEKGPTEEAIQQQIDVLIRSKMRISSVCSSADAVFVTTRALSGYGYDVWKTGADLSGGEIIIEGLRGCCGQMDVQCCQRGLFVAENSADRVVHYDFDGTKITQWGKSDRTGIDGFGSCCNPMNVCFDGSGHVYTAEASLGRIKKFDATGNLIDFIGDVDLVPGCKNVSIAVSPVNDNIYMLDLTRNHIVIMQPKTASDTVKRTAALETGARDNEQ
ncbi:MAG TPA: hypothetical protein DDW52_08885 [Planctomycetaceae bacterium]|nr:hypothetical protein [Planctomycetaceae bacterium]